MQFGFRKGKSCDHAVSNLVTKLEQALTNRKIALGIFIDISGAFDTVSIDFILKVLRNSPVSKSVYNILKYLLSNRRVTYTLGKAVLIRLLLKGFAQGGRLSPTLWNLVADPLLKKVNITEFLQALADDLASVIDGDNIDDIRRRAQVILDVITEWCSEAGLTINTSKSVIVIFTHRHHIKLDEPLLCSGTPLPIQTTVKYLGVHLDSKLTWSTHIQNRILAANIQQSKVKAITARHWGLNPATTSWIYKSVTRPKILYGSHLWSNSATQYKNNSKKINKVYNTAARSIAGTSKYSPMVSTTVIANLEPLNLSILRSSISTYNRVSDSSPSHSSLKPKGRLIPHLLHSNNILTRFSTMTQHLSTKFIPLSVTSTGNTWLMWILLLTLHLINSHRVAPMYLQTAQKHLTELRGLLGQFFTVKILKNQSARKFEFLIIQRFFRLKSLPYILRYPP